MKKSFILIFAVLIAAVLTGTAFAQTETMTEVKWKDIAPMAEATGIKGDFYAIGDTGLYMWIPDRFYEEELTDEEFENGYLLYLTTEDKSSVVSVTYTLIEGMTTDSYYDAIRNYEGTSNVEYNVINDIPAVSYDMTEQDSMTISFVDDEGYVFEFTFWPMSDESFQQVAAIMGASIQTAEG